MNDSNQLGNEDVDRLVKQLHEKDIRLREREQELNDKEEELSSQKEELNAAIEELIEKNKSLLDTLHELRDRSFELDQILYRTSHDLRSPLSSIKGILALLKLEPQTDIIRNYAHHIDSKAAQMDNLLRSLASLSKSILEEPVTSLIDLHKIIWQVIAELKYLPSWEQVEVAVELQEYKVKTDPALMVIIFQSLFSNAFIFREPSKKGHLTIRTHLLNGSLIIRVCDDGEGIALNVQPHIFDMFYRGSEKSLGNGLGLYVARKAAARLKGTIIVQLHPGNTCFTVTLPMVD